MNITYIWHDKNIQKTKRFKEKNNKPHLKQRVIRKNSKTKKQRGISEKQQNLKSKRYKKNTTNPKKMRYKNIKIAKPKDKYMHLYNNCSLSNALNQNLNLKSHQMD